MRDEAYRREQIPTYGSGGQQLALAERSASLLRRSQIGNGLAAVAVLTALAAVLTYGDFYGAFAGRAWTIAVLVCSVLLLGICTFQHVSWQRAIATWRGRSAADLHSLARRSFAAQLASYVVVAVALVTSIVSIVIASWAATSSILLMITMLLMVAAQILAGVQYVRETGPPGALPAHMHKAIESQQHRGPVRS